MARFNVFEVPSAFVGGFTQAIALSQSGRVTGTDFRELSPFAEIHAFIYADGVTRDVDVFGARAESRAINARGDIAGVTSDSFAFVLPAATGVAVSLQPLLPPEALVSGAAGISGSGEVVGGYGLADGSSAAFCYDEASGMRLLAASGYDIESAHAINDNHEIVGGRRSGLGYKYSLGTGSFTPLPFHPASINDAGVAIGNRDYATPERLDSAGAVHHLPTLGGDSCSVASVNNVGQIVGSATRTVGAHGEADTYGVLIEDATISVLDDLILSIGEPWHVSAGLGINDAGVVLASARRPSDYASRAVLLVPMPTLPGGGGGGSGPSPYWPPPQDPFERFRELLRAWLNRMPEAVPPIPWPPPCKIR